MKEIPLSQHKVALVDDEDYERVMRYKWHATKKNNGYYARHSSRTYGAIYMHHIVLCTWNQIDHINGDGLDNRKSNLRLANHSQNQQNSRKRSGSSQYKGVSWNGKKWFVQIKLSGHSYYMGTYDSEIEAAYAYDAAAIKVFGEFARTNFQIEESVRKVN